MEEEEVAFTGATRSSWHGSRRLTWQCSRDLTCHTHCICRSSSQNQSTEKHSNNASQHPSSWKRLLVCQEPKCSSHRLSLDTLMCTGTLTQAAPKRQSQKAQRKFVNILAVECCVVDRTKPKYLRTLGWWILLQSWEALRFSDHRGLVPKQITVNDSALTALLPHPKTLGTDQAIGSRPVVVHPVCFIRKTG